MRNWARSNRCHESSVLKANEMPATSSALADPFAAAPPHIVVRRLFTEALGTFLLVTVDCGGAMIAALRPPRRSDTGRALARDGPLDHGDGRDDGRRLRRALQSRRHVRICVPQGVPVASRPGVLGRADFRCGAGERDAAPRPRGCRSPGRDPAALRRCARARGRARADDDARDGRARQRHAAPRARTDGGDRRRRHRSRCAASSRAPSAAHR